MSNGVIIAICALVGSVVTAFFAYRSSKAAAKSAAKATADMAAIEGRKVDQEAYAKASAQYDRLIEQMSGQVKTLNDQLDRVFTQLANERDVSNTLRNEVWSLQRQIHAHTATIDELTAALAEMQALLAAGHTT